jgi:hypothetical protein
MMSETETMPYETENALEPVHHESHGGEIAPTTQQAMARHEIEGALILARRFPRNEDDAFARVVKSCNRWTFASMACYSYPRGGQQIQGPSVNLAREMARCWGNIRYGFDVVSDAGESRTVRGWAWDLETNAKSSQDATFAKLVYRKKGGWTKPDERDLRELTNKHGAIAVRNALLAILPPDLREDAIRASKETLAKDAAKDPDEARKRLVVAFQGIGVRVEDLELFLGHPLRQVTPEEIAELRGVWKSISDGNSMWAEYVKDKQPKTATAEELFNGKPQTQPQEAPKPEQPQQPTTQPEPASEAETQPAVAPDDSGLLAGYAEQIQAAESLQAVNQVQQHAVGNQALTDHTRQQIVEACLSRQKEIRSRRGPRSNGGELFQQ